MKSKALNTEKQNRGSADLDQLSALEFATLMNREDAKVSRAVRKALPNIAQAIDAISDRLAHGGRLIYVGSGTSGRIGALDASECPPTFGTDPAMIQYLIAGGEDALAKPIEAIEDSSELGTRNMAARRPGKKDVVVALAVVDTNATLLVAGENGIGKRTLFEEYRTQTRGGKGIITMKTNEKTGRVVGALTVIDKDEIMLLTQQGQMVRTPVNMIRETGRNTQGVKLINLNTSDKLTAIARVISETDEPEAAGETGLTV